MRPDKTILRNSDIKELFDGDMPYLNLDLKHLDPKGLSIFTSYNQALNWLLEKPSRVLYWYGLEVININGHIVCDDKEFDKWELIFATLNTVDAKVINIKNIDNKLIYVNILKDV